MSIADDLSELIGDMGAAGTAAERLSQTLGGLDNSATAAAAQLARASTVADRMETAAAAAGISVADMASTISDLAEKAAKLRVLEEAKKALDDLNGVQPPKQIDEVTAAMQRLQKQAHETKVLDEAKRRLGMTETEATGAAKGLGSLSESAKGAVDGLKPTSGVLGAVTQALEALGPKGKAVALALAVIVTVATAGAVALWKLVESAVAFSQEKDALAETFAAITDGAKSGLAVVNDLSDVAAKLPFDEGKVLGWGKAMAAAGKSGDALVQSINAIAASGAIMQDNGAAALAFSKRLQTAADVGEKIKLDRRMQRMLAETGVRASELAKALGVAEDKLGSMSIDAGKLGDAFEKALIAKGAGALEKMSLTWTSIRGKLSDAWGDLFEDLGTAVQPLMKAIRDLFAEFSAGTTLQGAAKSALTSFFMTVLGWAAKAVHGLHIVFLEVQIGALKAYVFLAPLVRIFRAILTNAEVLRGLKTIFVVIAGAIGLVVLAVAAVGATFLAIWTVVSFVVGAISTAISYVVGVIVGFVQSLVTGGGAGAKGFITGIVAGIKSGAGMVADAVKQLASGAVDAFTGFFQIKSPSRLMREHGKQLPAGAAEGVDEGAVQLEESLDGMWEVPKSKGGKRGPTKIVHIDTINFHGRADEFDDFRTKAERWLEEIAFGGDELEPA